MGLKIKFIIIASCMSLTHALALVEKRDIQTLESLITRYKVDEKNTPGEKVKLYATLAKELESYHYKDQALQYYEKVINLSLRPSFKSQNLDIDLLGVYTQYLFLLEKKDPMKAQSFYQDTLSPYLENRDTLEAKEMNLFWKDHFEAHQDNQNNISNRKMKRPFFNQYQLDKKLKELIKEKSYSQAYTLIKDRDATHLNINIKLEQDLLYQLSNEKKGKQAKKLYCESMLKDFPKSPSIPVEACRYLKTRSLKYGNLKDLLKRTQSEQPHLYYLIEALQDLSKEKK